MIKLVIFDLDGVLVNHFPLAIKCIYKVIEELNLPPLDKKFLKNNSSLDIKTGFELAYPKFKNLADDVNRVYEEKYIKNIKELNLLSNAKKVLDELKNKGLKICIMTQKSRRLTEETIKLLNFSFDFIITADEIKNSKPDPKPILRILKNFDIKHEEAIFVGDTPEDIEQGGNANLKTIIVATGMYSKEELKKHNPDYLIEDLIEVLDIIGV